MIGISCIFEFRVLQVFHCRPCSGLLFHQHLYIQEHNISLVSRTQYCRPHSGLLFHHHLYMHEYNA